MRPPECCICDREFNPQEEGGLIYFKRRPSDEAWDRDMKEKGYVGHPPYAEWFCKDHYDIAHDLKHLPIDEALQLIKDTE